MLFRSPDAVLRTTLIAGFPGETIKDHEETLRMIQEVHWDHLGAFTYSKEEDTPSYEMEDDVAEEEKQRRRNEIMELQESIVEKDHQKLIGTETEVLVEGIDPLTQMYIGRSAMYAPDGVDGNIRFHSEKSLSAGEFVKVRLVRINQQNMIGKEM